MSTKPTSEQLAPAVPALTRQYVEAAIREALNPLATAHSEWQKATDQQIDDLTKQLAEANNRLAKLERRYAEDDKFALTKARIAQFIEDTNLK